MSALLSVEGLRVRLPTPRGEVTIVDGVDYVVEAGEVFGVARASTRRRSATAGRSSWRRRRER